MKRTKPTANRRADILAAALTELGERGYASASTNAIAAGAGVAKGLVFHHFGDKDALFLAVVNEAARVIDPYFADALADAPRDLIGRILVIVERKISFIADEPRASRFLIVGMADAPPALRKQALAILDRSANLLWKQLLDGVDASMLRKGLRLEDAVAAIMLLSAGLAKQHEALTDTPAKAKRFDVDGAIAHARRMLAILRDGLYGARADVSPRAR